MRTRGREFYTAGLPTASQYGSLVTALGCNPTEVGSIPSAGIS